MTNSVTKLPIISTINDKKIVYTSMIANLSLNGGVIKNIDSLTIIMKDLYTIIIQFTMSTDPADIDNFLTTITPEDRAKKNNDGKTLEEVYNALIGEKNTLEKKIIDEIGGVDLKKSDSQEYANAQQYYNNLSDEVKNLSGTTVSGDMSKVENLLRIGTTMDELKKYNNMTLKDTEINKNIQETFSELKKNLVFNIVFILFFIMLISLEVFLSKQ